MEGDVGDPDWSPDGGRLAFDVWEGDAISMWTVNADGSGAKQVAACSDPCLQLSYPSWSPDGRSLVLVAYDSGPGGTRPHSAIQVLDLASGERRTVLENADGVTTYRYPRWSPDASKVVFQLEAYPDSTQNIEALLTSSVAVADVNGPKDQKPVPLTKPKAWAGYPDWGWTTNRIVYTTRDLSMFQTSEEGSNLYTMKPDGSDVVQVTRYAAGDIRATQPSWASDGRIVFTAVDHPRLTARVVAFVRPDGSELEITSISSTHTRVRPTG